MRARIATHGGEMIAGIPTVQHWTLLVEGEYIADTTMPRTVVLFRGIADAINRDHEINHMEGTS